MEDHLIEIGKLRFECKTSGDRNNPAVILLHGFPESNAMWYRLMEDIQDRFFCIAPNMRGYSPKARPNRVEEYHSKFLSRDIRDIAAHFNADKFHLVGHDWGAAIGWRVVHDFPDKILTWTALSVPHPRAMVKAIKTDKAQRKKSWYIFFFLWSWLPESYLLWNNKKNLKKIWKSASDLEKSEYDRLLGNRAGLKAAINYYRANFKRGKGERLEGTNVNTAFIWGNRDIAIGYTAAKLCKEYSGDNFQLHELDAGHWLMQRRYDEVRDLILSHLNS